MANLILYRPHRGGLAESLAEAVEVQSREELERRIGQPILAINKHLWDDRIGWDTHIVITAEGVVGMTNGPLEP